MLRPFGTTRRSSRPASPATGPSGRVMACQAARGRLSRVRAAIGAARLALRKFFRKLPQLKLLAAD